MNRRRFFHACSWWLSAVSAAFLAVPGIGFLLDPFSAGGRKKKRHRLLKLSDLEAGVPRKMMIIDQRVDAWTKYPKGAIGAVWLMKNEDEEVTAFSTVCPHLGCMVGYQEGEKKFDCPCHEAIYGSDGSIVSGPQQRGLDKLHVSVENVNEEAWVSVVYERFELGTAEKKPL